MARTTVVLSDDVEAEVENRLSYGDSKSEYIRDAVLLRLRVDEVLQNENIDDYQAEIEEIADRLRKD